MSLGITRKIDELGRIVVPKELRNTMNLKEGSLMEITANEDSIVMKKLSPLDRGREFAALIADTLSRQTDGAMVFVVSDDEIVAKCGKGSRDLDEIPEAVKHHIDKHRYSGGHRRCRHGRQRRRVCRNAHFGGRRALRTSCHNAEFLSFGRVE